MSPSPANSASTRIAALLEPIVAAAGFDLEDVEVSLARGNRQAEVRVLVDKDTGIDLDDVAVVSHVISGALDSGTDTERVLGGGSYVLEVSSPGVDRPLREPRHWRRNIGRLVAVATPSAEVTGRIVGVDENGVQLEIAGVKGRPSKTATFGFGELGPGRVQVEFNRVTPVGDPDGDLDGAGDDEDDLADDLEDDSEVDSEGEFDERVDEPGGANEISRTRKIPTTQEEVR